MYWLQDKTLYLFVVFICLVHFNAGWSFQVVFNLNEEWMGTMINGTFWICFAFWVVVMKRSTNINKRTTNTNINRLKTRWTTSFSDRIPGPDLRHMYKTKLGTIGSNARKDHVWGYKKLNGKNVARDYFSILLQFSPTKSCKRMKFRVSKIIVGVNCRLFLCILEGFVLCNMKGRVTYCLGWSLQNISVTDDHGSIRGVVVTSIPSVYCSHNPSRLYVIVTIHPVCMS
jgi:hypothetical protein